MSLRVAFFCAELKKLWVRDVVEWSRPLPREDESVLIIPEDYVAMDGEPNVDGVYWPLEPTDTTDVFIAIGTPFWKDTNDEERRTWLMAHGFHELATVEEVEAYDGTAGIAELMRETYDAAPSD